ncbi:MAG TPA: replication-relaxation family protein [Candidatus Acidoferrales bacterium]|jgi:hypothetical protein|nr:replication-relaxation family protein [Candidatus Acidoferrales bacterium]
MALAAQAGPRRDRQLYTSKGDAEILRVVAKYQFVTVEQAAEQLKRNVIAVRRRMMQLFQASLLNRERRSDLDPFVYFLSENGGNLAASYGFLPEPRWIGGKSPTHLAHDLEITNFHIALEKAFQNTTHTLYFWQQWRGDLKDIVDPNGEIELIPDARFGIDEDADALLEVVKSYESGYTSRESSLVKKLKAYKQLGIKRVYITMPTQLRVARFLDKIEDDIKSTQFWFTDEASYKRDILGKIWWTPADFRDRTYSIFK